MDEDQAVVEEELVLRVVNAGRRQRLRRLALTATIAVVAGGLIAGAIALFANAPQRSAPTADEQRDTKVVVHPGTPQPVSDQAQIYAAALREVSPGTTDVYIRIHTCDSAARFPASDDCLDARLPDDVQRDLDALVPANVSFVEQRVNPVEVDDPPLVIFGALEESGSTAKLGYELMCGPLCGQGETLLLTRQADGRWQVTGREGPSWIS